MDVREWPAYGRKCSADMGGLGVGYSRVIGCHSGASCSEMQGSGAGTAVRLEDLEIDVPGGLR